MYATCEVSNYLQYQYIDSSQEYKDDINTTTSEEYYDTIKSVGDSNSTNAQTIGHVQKTSAALEPMSNPLCEKLLLYAQCYSNKIL